MEKKNKCVPADYKLIENQIIGQIKKIDYILQLNQFASRHDKIQDLLNYELIDY